MKIADFVILAAVIVALAIALWYNHKDKKNGCGCCGNCSGCNKNCGIKNEKRGNSNEN